MIFKSTKIKRKNKRVFLGGTVDCKYRDELIPNLEIDHFNPIVPKDEWNEKCKAEEVRQRRICDYTLYTITPQMTGVLSIAEVTDDSNKRPASTILCYLSEYEGKKFSKDQIKSLEQVAKMIKDNGANVFTSLDEVAKFLNKA